MTYTPKEFESHMWTRISNPFPTDFDVLIPFFVCVNFKSYEKKYVIYTYK